MKIGNLDRLVTLLRPTATEDGMGGRNIDEWEEVATVWAEFHRPRTSQVAVEGGIASVQTMEVKIRMREDVAPGWRMRFENDLRDIEHVYAIDRRETFLVTRLVEYGAPEGGI